MHRMTLRAARIGQPVGEDEPVGYVDTVLSDHGYEWLNHRPRGGLAQVRALHGPDGQLVDVSVALARIEAAVGTNSRCWRPTGRRYACRRTCCTRRHRL